jgi:hypothetical protein
MRLLHQMIGVNILSLLAGWRYNSTAIVGDIPSARLAEKRHPPFSKGIRNSKRIEAALLPVRNNGCFAAAVSSIVSRINDRFHVFPNQRSLLAQVLRGS